MKISEVQKLLDVNSRLSAQLIPLFARKCDAIKAEDRDGDVGRAHYDAGVQEAFTGFLRVLCDLTLDDIETIVGKQEDSS